MVVVVVGVGGVTCRASLDLVGCREPCSLPCECHLSAVMYVKCQRCDAQSIPEHVGAKPDVPAPRRTLP